MDDFDDFLNQLGTINPPVNTMNVPRNPPPQMSAVDDIDALLGEMENFQVPPSLPQQPPPQFNNVTSFRQTTTYSNQPNEIDDLLEQFSSPQPTFPHSTTTTTTTITTTTTKTNPSLDDELDELMNLAEPTRTPPQLPPVSNNNNNVNDLDDLMNQLGTPVSQPANPRANLQRQSSGNRIARSSINPQTKPQTPPADDLDSLLNQINTPTPSQFQPTQQQRVSSRLSPQPQPTSDLDDLMNQFNIPPSNPTPSSALKPTPLKATPSPTSDLDDLMSQFNIPPSNPTPSPSVLKPTPLKPTPSPSSDLDDLMNQLNTPPSTTNSYPSPSMAKPAPLKATPSPTSDLDDLMNQLNVSSQPQSLPLSSRNSSRPPVANNVVMKSSTDELDDLMSSLGQPSNSQPVMNNQQFYGSNQMIGNNQPSPQLQRTSVRAVQRTPSPVVQTTSPSTSELDDLLSSLDSQSSSSMSSQTSSNMRSPPPRSPSGSLDELDSLVAELNVPSTNSSRPMSTRSPPITNNFGAPNNSQSPRPVSSRPMTNPSQPMYNSPQQFGGRGAQPPMMNNYQSPSSNNTFQQTTYQQTQQFQSPNQFGGRGAQPPMMNNSPQMPYGNQQQGFGRGAPPQSSPYGMNSPSPPPAGGRGVAPIGRGAGGVPPVGGRGRGGFGGNPNELDQLLGSLSNQMNNIKDLEASKGVCHFCQKYIYAECIQAMGRTYHPDHFVCSSCQQPLGTSSFYETNNEPTCEKCYQNMFCPRCAYCNEAIADRCVNALNQKWHVQCFVCNSCCKSFSSGTFFERGGMPYCQECFQGTFSSKCAGCGNIASGQLLNALGQKWHPQCFACSYCRRPFNGQPYFEKDGKPFCEQHYHASAGSICAGCKTSIVGRCVDALGKKWHPEHFVCSYCMNPLAGGGYTEQHGSPYCQECYSNLF